jgi:hypothetical protein
MSLSSCERNRELVKAVAENLSRLAGLSQRQIEARNNGDVALATELDCKLDLAFGEKERSVGAWQEHVREHGC